MNPIKKEFYLRRSLNPDVEQVEPEELKDWLEEIEDKWREIPKVDIPSGHLHSLTVICDGNRRAAQERNLDPFYGHRAGVEVIKGVARACRQWEIPYLTFWTWSTENWQREKRQVKYVMQLAARVLADDEFIGELVENEVNFVHLGRKDRLPRSVLEALENLEEKTQNFDRYWLNLAMDYGGLDEVARAVVDMVKMVEAGGMAMEEIEKSPEIIYNFLDTAEQPNPDLIIRTGVKEGEVPHTSGLMPLQSAYACWDFVPDLFPNFTPQTLADAMEGFVDYERRFGK